MPSSPPALSVGRLCAEEGCEFHHDPATDTATFTTPKFGPIEVTQGHNCPYVSGTRVVKVSVAVPFSTGGGSSSAGPAPEASSGDGVPRGAAGGGEPSPTEKVQRPAVPLVFPPNACGITEEITMDEEYPWASYPDKSRTTPYCREYKTDVCVPGPSKDRASPQKGCIKTPGHRSSDGPDFSTPFSGPKHKAAGHVRFDARVPTMGQSSCQR